MNNDKDYRVSHRVKYLRLHREFYNMTNSSYLASSNIKTFLCYYTLLFCHFRHTSRFNIFTSVFIRGVTAADVWRRCWPSICTDEPTTPSAGLTPGIREFVGPSSWFIAVWARYLHCLHDPTLMFSVLSADDLRFLVNILLKGRHCLRTTSAVTPLVKRKVKKHQNLSDMSEVT